MFTGIVQELGTVSQLQRRRGVLRMSVTAPQTASRVRPLESVAVNGVCLTVVERAGGRMTFEVIPETQRRTTLGALRAGHRVNLEPSLTVTDRLNGHLVFGHVDGMGTVAGRRARAGQLSVTIRIAPALRPLLVAKGPVTVDGISLTVGAALTRTAFTVHLIPETLRQTTLGARLVGQRVNVELDYFAKLLRQWSR